MALPKDRDQKAAPVTHVTTKTGRILRVTDTAADPATQPAAAAGTPVQTSAVMDPARRADVLFRVRRDEGHEISAWWMVGAFLLASGLVVALVQWVPGGA
ncbi:MAG: hypothetical protein WA971_09320 [Microbacterium sp.]